MRVYAHRGGWSEALVRINAHPTGKCIGQFRWSAWTSGWVRSALPMGEVRALPSFSWAVLLVFKSRTKSTES